MVLLKVGRTKKKKLWTCWERRPVKISLFKAPKSWRRRSGVSVLPSFPKHLSSSSGCLAGSGHAAACLMIEYIFGRVVNFPCGCTVRPLVPLCCSPKALHEHHYYPCKLAQLTWPRSGPLFVNPSFFNCVWTADQRGARGEGGGGTPSPLRPLRPPLSRQIVTPVNIKQRRAAGMPGLN